MVLGFAFKAYVEKGGLYGMGSFLSMLPRDSRMASLGKAVPIFDTSAVYTREMFMWEGPLL